MKRSTIICNIYNELCWFVIWWSDLQFFQHRKGLCVPPFTINTWETRIINLSMKVFFKHFFWIWYFGLCETLGQIPFTDITCDLCLSSVWASILGYAMYLILQVSQMAYYIFISDICDVYCICHTLLETSTVKICLDFYTVWVREGCEA